MKKTTAVEVVPTKPGTPFGGGIYMGRFFDGVHTYALIVAPRAEGEFESVTHAQALKKAKALRIGGNKDWTLPTRLQTLQMYEAREALNKKEAFEPAWYWTSQQSASYDAFAWCQSFGYGLQYDDYVSSQLRARAVRRLKL